MSVVGDIMGAVRQVLTLELRVAQLAEEIGRLKANEENTRERLIRLEGIIEMAMRGPQRSLGDR